MKYGIFAMSLDGKQSIVFVHTRENGFCGSFLIKKEKNAGLFVYSDKESPFVFRAASDKNAVISCFKMYNSVPVYKTHKNARYWCGLFIY